jgi:hypothetical protein
MESVRFENAHSVSQFQALPISAASTALISAMTAAAPLDA